MATDPITGETIPASVIALFSLLLAASFAFLALLVRRIARGERLVSRSPRRIVPWNILHLLAAFVFFVCATLVCFPFFAMVFQVEMPMTLESTNAMAASLCVSIVASLVVFVGFMLIVRPQWSDIGLSGSDADRDLLTGLGAFLVIAPWLYAFNMLLALFFDGQHPLVDAIEEAGSTELLLLASASAILVAPVVEEFMFRVLLQGWLERVLAPGASDKELAALSPVSASNEGGNDSATPSAQDGSVEQEPDPNPFAPPVGEAATSISEQGDVRFEQGEPASDRPIYWAPIVISSIAFSLVHLGHGPAPVPLFFLALVLGYLYQRTHRILPCIALHMSLNAFSMGILWLSVAL